MKKRLLSFYFFANFFLICPFLIAQELPRFVPASPTASELGKFGQVPVGMYTGTLQKSIPLFEINQSGFTLPISLEYSSNGVNIDKYASTVGMDWSLNAGGVITRVLMDAPDEEGRVNFPNYEMGSSEMNTFLHGIMTNMQFDTQPDIFAFNVNGYSGKFYFDNNWDPILIEPAPIKIEKLSTFGYDSNSTAPDFKITTPDGIQYWFGGNNSAEHSFSRTDELSSGGISPPSLVSEVSWYVSKIELLNGNTINFNYVNHNFNYNSGISQVAKGSYSEGTDQASYFTPAKLNTPTTIVNKSYTSISNISNITWDNGTIDFEYSERYTGSTLLKLDRIKLRDKTNQIIKGFHLGYIIAIADNYYSNIGAEENSKRLFLQNLTPLDKYLNDQEGFVFEYYNINTLPPRLSFSRDYWGYFNGVVNEDLTSSNIVSFYNPGDYRDSPPFNYDQVQFLFKDDGGDRNPNGSFGVNGLLKKITYPTNGFNSFIYEPHSYYGDITISETKQKNTSVQTGSDDFGGKTSSVTILDAASQEVDLYLYVDKAISSAIGCPSDFEHTHPPRASFQVFDITDSSNIFPINIFFDPAYGSTPTGATSVTIEENFDNSNPYYVQLESGHDYEFEVSIYRPCLDAGLSIEYNSGSQEIQDNIEVGGLRIKEILSDDSNGNSYTEIYNYGDLDCLNCSSGVREQIKPSLSFMRNESYSDGYNINNSVFLSSSSLFSLYFNQSYHIAYPIVIKSFEEGLSNGVIRYEFNTFFDIPPIIIGDPNPGTPMTNSHGSGELLKESYFKFKENGLVKLKETTNSYSYDSRIQDEILGFTVGHNGASLFTLQLFDSSSSHNVYSINKYFVRSKWRYLSETMKKQYDENGLNPVETLIEYSYDNPEHLQVSSISTTTSDTSPFINKTYYPSDIDNTSDLGFNDLSTLEFNAIQLLKSQNRLILPIQAESYKDIDNDGVADASELKNAHRSNYKDWGNNIVDKEFVQTLKGKYSTLNGLEDRIHFVDYDSSGNPMEVSKENGPHIVYLWGYQDQYPIAKIENATYSEVSNALGVADLSTVDEEDLSAIDLLRTNLPKAMVTTYEYELLVGMTSMKDPKGQVTTYEYDDSGRLHLVKDDQGNLLKENTYHFKN